MRATEPTRPRLGGIAPQDLTALLRPLESSRFLRECWGKKFQRIPGTRGKFSDLLPWPVLSQILEQHRLDSPRIRLTREGKPVAPASFLTHQTSRRKTEQSIPRLLATELNRQLRNGATLVIDAVDELHAPITALAESLEHTFHVRVQVNAYAGWRTSHGFDLHWDDHDVLILQVAGRKKWRVYGMTRKYPLARDVEPTVEPPSEPVWEGLVEDGDLLYIPRGWWHVATPLDEPTLHLTVGVNNLNGADLLAWFAERLRSHEQVRRDLPLFATAEEQCAHLSDLHRILLNEWNADVLRRFIDDIDARSRPRARLNFPWSAMADGLPPEDLPFKVRWNSARPIKLRAVGSELTIDCNGRRWRFSANARPILEALASGQPYSEAELQSAVAGKLEATTVRVFLRELASSGLIIVLEPRSGI